MTDTIKKVVLAYSGGLDTSVILRWLQDNYGCEVVTFTADIGQGDGELAPEEGLAGISLQGFDVERGRPVDQGQPALGVVDVETGGGEVDLAQIAPVLAGIEPVERVAVVGEGLGELPSVELSAPEALADPAVLRNFRGGEQAGHGGSEQAGREDQGQHRYEQQPAALTRSLLA